MIRRCTAPQGAPAGSAWGRLLLALVVLVSGMVNSTLLRYLSTLSGSVPWASRLMAGKMAVRTARKAVLNRVIMRFR